MTAIEASAGFESMLCVSRLEEFLQDCWNNELFETHKHTSV